MILSSEIVKCFRTISQSNGGVYSTADLAVLLNRSVPSRVTEGIHALVRNGLLLKVRRGLYVDRLNGYRPEIVGQRWLAPSYLSTEAALDRHGLCATGITIQTYVTMRLVPRKKLARRRLEGHQFLYRHIAEHLFFGYQSQDGVLLAEPEKAVLDFLYFSFKKQTSVISAEDIDFGRLHRGPYRRYLRAYRQRGFTEYALSFMATGGKTR
jgi:hypothetical protein